MINNAAEIFEKLKKSHTCSFDGETNTTTQTVNIIFENVLQYTQCYGTIGFNLNGMCKDVIYDIYGWIVNYLRKHQYTLCDPSVNPQQKIKIIDDLIHQIVHCNEKQGG